MISVVYQASRTGFFPLYIPMGFSITLLGASKHIYPESYALHTDLVCTALQAGSCEAL